MIENIQFINRATENDSQFSILIPSWNNLPYLINAVESIREHSFYKHQIIVHVNEGTDGTIDWVKQQPDIDYTYSKKNIGLCYALNATRQLVKTAYMVYLNDDMYVLPDWDKYLMDAIKEIGHNLFFLNGTGIEPYAGNPCIIHKNYGTDIESFQKQKLLEEFALLEKHDWQAGSWSPSVMHVSVWDLIGGYSIEFSPAHYSDPDVAMKLWQAGIRIFKGVAKSRVYHFGSKSTGRFKKHKAYYKYILKWGITAGTFTKYYLRMGQPYNGVLPEPVFNSSAKIKNLFKRLVAIFKI
ncbi:MAG: glycosyltransferase family 2 protein [Bacteroidetes bacterium]|nr:glycosyltransferase family 2 protein [Bacteroidota bacterium]MBS1641968.1 glycosyltransferase family 2 protein [Bacteroidota bacterium]MBS1670542.1 glycosyltransferase family 2 protein [Bacteroidota bacterium]